MQKLLFFLFPLLFLLGCSPKDIGDKVGVGEKSPRGVFKSTDGGENFETRSKINEETSLATTDVLCLKVDPNNSETVYLGSVESGLFRTENGGEQWHKLIDLARIYEIAIDPRDSQTIYVAGISKGRGKILKSIDGGENWIDIYAEPAGNLLITSLVIDHYNPDILYAGNSRGVLYKTSNRGEGWTNIAELEKPILGIALDAGDTRDIYLLVHQKGLYKIDHSQNVRDKDGEIIEKSENELAEGVKIVEPDFDFGDVFSLMSDPNKAGVVYVGSSEGLFRSEDFGNKWQEIPTLEGPGEIPIRTLAIGKNDSRIIYFGARGVFYRSFNYGESWQAMEFRTSYSMEDLALEPSNDRVVYLGLRKIEN
jgi:photosystem II stability/assembly factor-like uncharacterized protein